MSTAVQDSPPASVPIAGNPAPRLLAAGIDVTEISKRPLPAEIWQAIERAALSGRNGSIRWELSCMLYEFSHRQLDEGKSSEEVTEWLCDRDVRSLLWSQPEVRCAVAETALPRSLLRYVNRVRRRLGWRLPGWWNQDDRAHSVSELCLAYHRRLSAGESVDSLQKVKFSTVANELRRGILVQRSWISRAFRKFRIACVWGVGLAVITWVTLWIRLVIAVPGRTQDAIDRFDDANRQVAEEDRAWPIIR
ncbi:MAG: hypothetical protein NT069_24745, partial [Planctomycetota bacterium]|nr:hypothetical protein [Planctomycetota bacterium]